jgi:acyl-CoA thioesterase-1
MFLFVCCGKTSENNQNTEKEVEDTAEETKTSNENDDVDKNTILFFGDSLTAGLGLDTSEAYPALIQEKLDSLGYDYQVVNAGLSGDTTASGKSRIDWILKQDIDVFILELGANDGLRGIPLSETRKNLQDIIDIVKSKNPKTEIIIAGMQIPPNMGQDYTTEFKNIFPNLAKQNNVALIPFLLEDVAGNPDLNQNDGIHPTAEGYEIVSENVWEVLEGVLKKK